MPLGRYPLNICLQILHILDALFVLYASWNSDCLMLGRFEAIAKKVIKDRLGKKGKENFRIGALLER